MSQKERRRLVVLEQVKAGELALVQAAQVMRVSYRQAKRVWRRFRQAGDAGLVHKSRGRPGARRKPAPVRRRVLARYAARYPDFGPTLAAEKLQAEGLKVDHETLRRWLLGTGQWTVRRRRQKHRQWRERKACLGEMVQLDGSHHDWFEGRAPRAVLMVMVDDATNRTWAQFFAEETTRASFDMMEQWARRHGLPQSVYVDRDSIYRCERLPTVAEQVAGKEPQTQFGRAMQQLGVDLLLAHSPQAKGRVERRHGLLQDRLVKELRLAGISDWERANEFLRRTFLPELNRRFTVAPASAADVHRPVPPQLDAILSWEHLRVVQRDWTVVCEGRWYQIQKEHEMLSLVGRQVTVRQRRCGKVELLHGGRVLRSQALAAKPKPKRAEPRRVGREELSKPAQSHPWRRFGMGAGRRYWREVKEQRRAARLPALASGRSSLRSDLPASSAGRRKQTSESNR